MGHVVRDVSDMLTIHVHWEERQGSVFVFNLLDSCSKFELTRLRKLVAKMMSENYSCSDEL